jgi:hypothetical protein
MIRRYPRAPITSASMNLMGHGNSLMYGSGTSSSSKRWLSQMLLLPPFAGKGMTVRNAGVAGMGISTNSGAGTMTASAPTSIDPHYDPARLNVLFLHEFINDLKGNSNNVTLSLNAFANYVAARRAAAANAGARLFVVAMTTTPAGEAPSGQGQAWVNARMTAIASCNAAMRADPRRYCDLLIDIAATQPFASMYAADDWTPAAFVATGLWGADDLTHFGDSGHTLMAAAAARGAPRIRRV